MGCELFNGLVGIGEFGLCEENCWDYLLDDEADLVSEAICSL
jgi:hypothetical protein